MAPGLVAAAAASPLPPPPVTGWTKVPSFNVHDGSAVDVDVDVDIDADADIHIDVDGGGSKGDHDDDEMALEATTVPVPSKSASRVSVSDDGCADYDDEGEGCCGIGEGGEGGCSETSSRWKCRVLEGIADGTCETLTLVTSESDPSFHGEVSHLLNSNSSVRHLQLRDGHGEEGDGDPFCLFDDEVTNQPMTGQEWVTLLGSLSKNSDQFGYLEVAVAATSTSYSSRSHSNSSRRRRCHLPSAVLAGLIQSFRNLTCLTLEVEANGEDGCHDYESGDEVRGDYWKHVAKSIGRYHPTLESFALYHKQSSGSGTRRCGRRGGPRPILADRLAERVFSAPNLAEYVQVAVPQCSQRIRSRSPDRSDSASTSPTHDPPHHHQLRLSLEALVGLLSRGGVPPKLETFEYAGIGFYGSAGTGGECGTENGQDDDHEDDGVVIEGGETGFDCTGDATMFAVDDGGDYGSNGFSRNGTNCSSYDHRCRKAARVGKTTPATTTTTTTTTLQVTPTPLPPWPSPPAFAPEGTLRQFAPLAVAAAADPAMTTDVVTGAVTPPPPLSAAAGFDSLATGQRISTACNSCSSSNLTTIKLCNNGLRGSDMMLVIRALEGHTNLAELDVSWNPFGTSGACVGALVATLATMGMLERVDASRCSIPECFVAEFAALLWNDGGGGGNGTKSALCSSSLVHLDLSRNGGIAATSTIEAFVDAMRTNYTLSSLVLPDVVDAASMGSCGTVDMEATSPSIGDGDVSASNTSGGPRSPIRKLFDFMNRNANCKTPHY